MKFHCHVLQIAFDPLRIVELYEIFLPLKGTRRPSRVFNVNDKRATSSIGEPSIRLVADKTEEKRGKKERKRRRSYPPFDYADLSLAIVGLTRDWRGVGHVRAEANGGGLAEAEEEGADREQNEKGNRGGVNSGGEARYQSN